MNRQTIFNVLCIMFYGVLGKKGDAEGLTFLFYSAIEFYQLNGLLSRASLSPFGSHTLMFEPNVSCFSPSGGFGRFALMLSCPQRNTRQREDDERA
jgi:hypothetical protein